MFFSLIKSRNKLHSLDFGGAHLEKKIFSTAFDTFFGCVGHILFRLKLDNFSLYSQTGLTPLMEAASGGYVEVGRVLLDKGADVNAAPVPSSRDTALTIAADKGHYRFVELLLHRGAAVDVKNKKGNSPLWLACNGG